MPSRHAHRDTRPGDGLVRVGGVVFLLGLVVILVTFLPFVLEGYDNRPLGLDVATFLAPLGLALALVGLLRGALGDRRRARAEDLLFGDEPQR